MSSRGDTPAPHPARFFLLYAAPLVLLLGWRVFPLMRGSETLYFRDVLNTHLEMKAAQAEAMRRGTLPLIDRYRAGGQPLLGNPDSVPLYPDNLVYLFASPLYALNTHFWLHLLLAPWAMFWMARAWGLGREAAWAAGACYALSGYFLSHLSLYNQIAGATLAPALVAACLHLGESRRYRLIGPAAAILWGLLLLAGEPLMALLSLGLAVAAVLFRHGARRNALLPLGLVVACGTLLAAPQIVEFLRIFGLSYRGQLGYGPETRTLASWDPRQIMEWLLPFFFGRPDRLGAGSFWGHRFFTDRPPYYFSLYPGLLTLALLVPSFRCGGRAGRWAAGAAAAGLFLALGRFNPAAAWLFELGRGLVRYPVRMWLAIAMGSALLAGIGFERAILAGEPRARTAFHLTLASLGLLIALGGSALWILPGPAEGWLRGIMPSDAIAGAAAAERLRWVGLCLRSLAVLGLLALAAFLARHRPSLGGACALLVHTAAQVVLLGPLLASDAVGPYLRPSPLLAAIPPAALVAHGSSEGLFGDSAPAARVFPDRRAFWFERRAYHEAYPFAGMLWGRRYELNVSSEGLDSFLTTAARDAVRTADEPDRLRLLAAWGIEYLILDRPLDLGDRGQAEPVLHLPSFGGTIHLYRIPAACPGVLLVGAVRRAPTLNAAVDLLKDSAFDPCASVVLPGGGPPADGPRGEVRVLHDGPESLAAETAAPAAGVLVVQRSYLPLYRATVDGVEVPLRIANLHRLGVEVPAGRHGVEIRTDRRPLHLSLVAVALGLLGLGALGRTNQGTPSAVR